MHAKLVLPTVEFFVSFFLPLADCTTHYCPMPCSSPHALKTSMDPVKRNELFTLDHVSVGGKCEEVWAGRARVQFVLLL